MITSGTILNIVDGKNKGGRIFIRNVGAHQNLMGGLTVTFVADIRYPDGSFERKISIGGDAMLENLKSGVVEVE